MKSIPLCAALLTGILLSSAARASEQKINSPQAAARGHAQNYKDMVLATCLAQAYRDDAGAAADAGSSVAALREWTYFDLDLSPDAVQALVDNYLARDYSHPLVESEIKGIRFDFLKCMDLYHSKALEDLAKRLVIDPKRGARRR